MRANTRGRMARGAALATAVSVGVVGLVAAPAAAEDGPVEAGIVVQKVENLPEDFINGVDVSSVLSLEESGVVFRDDDGQPADLFAVLAGHGITDVRVRVWNDPFDAAGNGYGGGNVDVARAVEIGERATDAGLRVLVDFHYSDFWADPGKQDAPKAWEGMTVTQKAAAVGDFTADALEQFAAAGVDVRMVQVGNETNGAVAGVTTASDGWPAVAQIFSAGSAAVRDVLPDALVAVHFTNPESANRYDGYADQLAANGVDYDVFASSYYPYWHGDLDNLTEVLSDVATEHSKKVMVAETSWAYTLEDGDGHGNVIDLPSEATQYPVSVQGQATAVRDVIQAVVNVGDAGIGVFYWEPAWLPVGPPSQLPANRLLWEEFGSGWATSYAGEYDPDDAGQWYGGSAWDNQALFDHNGVPLESLNVFAYARTGATAPRDVTDVEDPAVTFTDGDPIVLPATVEVSYNDGTTDDEAVEWSDAADWISGPGVYRISGTTASGHATTATVTVLSVNLLRNPGFEDPDIGMWTKTGAALTVRATDDPHTGLRSSHFYSGSAFSFTLTQQVTGVPAGSYTASAAVQGDGENASSDIRITLSSGGSSTFAPFELNNWNNWSIPTTAPVTVAAGGTVTVTISASLPAGAWGTIDDVVITRAASGGADTSDLEAAVARAESLDRDIITEASLAVLDDALEVAEVVLAADTPDAQKVAEALDLLNDALDGLELDGEAPTPTVVPVAITVVEGEPVALPATVGVRGWNGAVVPHPVTWSDAASWISSTGEYEIPGVTEDGLPAVATVTVTARQWIRNPGFESTDVSMWTISGSGLGIGGTSDAAAGARAASFWLDRAYTASVSQQITGVSPGTYTLAATTQGDGEAAGDAVTLRASTSTGTASAPMELAGWQAFRTATTPVFSVGADGALTVAVSLTLSAGAWGTIDEFRLERAGTRADTSALEVAVADASALDPARYTPWSYAPLADAIAKSAVVVAADWPTPARVQQATALLADARAGLVRRDADTATAVPARGVLSQDNGWDTGLLDGDYNVKMNLWWGQNASSFRLYENGVLIATVPLVYNGLQAQYASVRVTGKPNGTYVYTGVLVNTKGTTAVSPVTVGVTAANPGKPVLSHDNSDGDGKYTVTANMWWGTNATSYRFYENGALAGQGALTANSPNAQLAKLDVTGRAKGTYVYRVDFINAAGTTSSATLTVTVKK